MQFAETIIVGGGPGGSSCAGKLKQRGHDTLILDRKTFPRVKLCAGWITEKVMSDLQFSQADYPHAILELEVRTHFPFLPVALPWFPTEFTNYSIRRVEFDHWLLDRAGVPVIEHTVSRIRRAGELYIIDDKFSCRNLVGAGGTMCPVRRQLFPDNRGRTSQVATLEKEFEYAGRQEICHLYFFDRGLKGYAWYVPKADGFVNVGIGGKCKYFKKSGTKIHDHFQGFLDRLVREKRLDRSTAEQLDFSGHPYFLTSYHGEVQKDHCYLIGDSAGLATLDLGEGIGPAIESGLLAASAILGEAAYSRAEFTTYSSGGLTGQLLRRLLPVRGTELKVVGAQLPGNAIPDDSQAQSAGTPSIRLPSSGDQSDAAQRRAA